MTEPALFTVIEQARRAVIARVDMFITATGMADSTLGTRAVGDDTFIERLRQGRDVKLKNIERLELYLIRTDPSKPWDGRTRALRGPKA